MILEKMVDIAIKFNMVFLVLLAANSVAAQNPKTAARVARKQQRMEAMQVDIDAFESAVNQYEIDLQTHNRYVEQMRSLQERNSNLAKEYDGMTKYTTPSGDNTSKRNDLQNQMKETAHNSEQTRQTAERSLDRALERAKNLSRAAFANKAAASTAGIAKHLKTILAKQVLYLQNGLAYGEPNAKETFQGARVTERMQKAQSIDKATEKIVEFKSDSNNRTMKMRTGDFLTLKTLDGGISRVQIHGFTQDGQVVVKNLQTPSLRGLLSFEPYVVDFTKVADVSLHMKGNGLAALRNGEPSAKLSLQLSNLERFRIASLNLWNKLRPAQTGTVGGTTPGAPVIKGAPVNK